MKVYYLGEGNISLSGHEVLCRRLEEAPSLISLVKSLEPPCVLALDQRQCLTYSPAHIVAAARSAAHRGMAVVILAAEKTLPEKEYYTLTEEPEQLPTTIRKQINLLQEREKNARKAQGTPKPPASRRVVAQRLRALSAPDWEPRLITVFGSQARMGCTTQCVQLYHYFTALGYEAAILEGREQLQLLTGSMVAQVLDTGVQLIEGIPFLTGDNTQPPYSLYIEDCGILTPTSVKRARDGCLCVLVVGNKPWELGNTAQAMGLLPEAPPSLVILSFPDPTDEQLDKGTVPLIHAPWQPNPFQGAELRVYDQTLLPLMEKIIS